MNIRHVRAHTNSDRRMYAAAYMRRFVPLANTGKTGEMIMIMDRIALILTIIGALNWGSIGLFQFDIVAWICGGQSSLLSRIIYTVVALAGIWCISLIFRAHDSFDQIED